MKKNAKLVLCLLIVIVLAVGILTACNTNSKLTMANYDKINCATLNYTTMQYEGGMTLNAVKDILGEPDSSSSTTVMGVSATAYVWGNDKKCIAVSFVDGQAIYKTQVGLV